MESECIMEEGCVTNSPEVMQSNSSQEIKGEEMVVLARSGFGAQQSIKKKETFIMEKRPEIPSAAALVVNEYERAVIFRLGRLTKGGARGPGLFFILPCTDNYCKVDLRTECVNVIPQEILSRDSVTVSVDAVVYYRVRDATVAICSIAKYKASTQLLAATTLRTVLGTKTLTEILSEREKISQIMQSSLDEASHQWGVNIERVEIKDVSLPKQMQRAMAAEAESTREARAKVIAAEGEQKASRALKEAADIIAESPGALQLRYLQTLTSIAAEKNSTIIFPLPMELLRGIGGKFSI